MQKVRTGARMAPALRVPARLGAWLTIALGLPVLAFFVFAAFCPATLAAPFVAGKPTTYWFACRLALIAWSVLLGGIYALVLNRAPDRKSSAWKGGGLAAVLLLGDPAEAADAPRLQGELMGLDFRSDECSPAGMRNLRHPTLDGCISIAVRPAIDANVLP